MIIITIKRSMQVFFYLFLLGLTGNLAAANDTIIRPLKTFTIRGGLPNFYHKLKKKHDATIVYLGGSITAAQNGWRDQSMQELQRRFPHAAIRQVNAGIGGTGSDLGVFRLERDVLSKTPDLVFVEFAVNDGGKNRERIHQAMEGIVRKIWKQLPHTDICFVYTFSADMAETLAAGRFWRSMDAMEDIADFYAIPSVFMGAKAIALYKGNKLILKGDKEVIAGKTVFSPDNVHPYAQTGHKLYTEILTEALNQMHAKYKSVRHRLRQAFDPRNWQDAQMISFSELARKGRWTLLDHSDTIGSMFARQMPSLYRSAGPDASARLQFKGRLAGVFDIAGPGCGQYSITIDGRDTVLVPRFDKHSNYYRLHYFLLPPLNNTHHTIELRQSNIPLNKVAILNAKEDYYENPARYQGQSVYGGWCLILGTLE